MDFLELVRKRQSVRRYLDKPIPREVLDRCLEAARLSPSACNAQPWFFIVVDSRDLIKKISQECFSGVYSINSFARDAAALIVVITERSKYIARLGGYLRGVQYSLIDIGIACEHLILQAQEEGLGTCWLGWFNEKRLKKILNISREKKVDVIISLGYPETEKLRKKIRRSLDGIRQFYKK